MQRRDGTSVGLALKRGHCTCFHVHDANEMVGIGDEEIGREALVLADLVRVVDRVTKMVIIKAVAHVLDLSDNLKARASLVELHLWHFRILT